MSTTHKKISHSPGPWHYVSGLYGTIGGVRAPKGYICFMTKPTWYDNQSERYDEEKRQALADAYLIASAPDMLEMLKKISGLLRDHEETERGVSGLEADEIDRLLLSITGEK